MSLGTQAAGPRLAGTALLMLLLACGRDTIALAEWDRMSREDRLLYVQSLVGEEKAKKAKGGHGRDMNRPPEEYVSQIDQAYGRGDARDVHEIFAELPR